MEKREIICISCPIGCHLTAAYERGDNGEIGDISVTGNRCRRGVIYGTEEILAPRRMVTATCAIDSTLMARIPVKSTSPVPKELIDDLLNELYLLNLTPPISLGDSVISNFRDRGVDVVATRTLTE